MKLTSLLLATTVGLCHADLYVTNFTAINGTSGASGVWRNHTTSTDLPAFPVALTQLGGAVQPADGSDTGSIIASETITDPFYPFWQDIPPILAPPSGVNIFEPNFIGDYINIETAELTTTTVTIDFGAMITDPAISFSDIEDRTTLSFPAAFSITGNSGNLSQSANTVTSDGTFVPVVDDEGAGSLQFTGTFESITFDVIVADDLGDPSNTEDRTGYVVSTTTEPQPLASGATPVLAIWRSGDDLTLTWDIGTFDSIQMSGATSGVGGWMIIPGLDPGAVGMWTGSIASLGEDRYFRGVYTP